MTKLKPGISATLIVYHEQDIIRRCLDSLKNHVDEIIVIHDGPCQDDTLKICKKYTNKVYVGKRTGNPEFHRVAAIKKAKFEWILRIDADEYLSTELQRALPQLIKAKDVDGYALLWKIWDGQQYISQTYPYKNALIKVDQLYLIQYSGTSLETYGNLVYSRYNLEHKPRYNNFTFSKFRSKWLKWAEGRARLFVNHEFTYFNCRPEIIQNFESMVDKQIKYAHPLLMPFWFVYSFVKSFFYRHFGKSIRTWHIALLQGCYGAALCWYLWKYKHQTS